MQPEFCITRPSGAVTALIAVDELPPFVTIRGVPRCLGQIDHANGMENLGTVNARGQFYTIDVAVNGNTHAINAEMANGESNAETAMAPQSAITIGGDGIFRQAGGVDAVIWNPSSEERTIMAWRNGVNDNTVANTGQELVKLDDTPSRNIGAGSQNVKNSKTTPKKEYCSYWIRRGECDYAQQGCLYKHDMPRDAETLGRLGLRDIPRWYREKYKVKSIVGSDGNDSRTIAGRSWRQTGPMAPVPVPRFALPPPRFNVGVTEGEVANGALSYAPVAGATFGPNEARFAREMGVHMMHPAIRSSLPEEINRGLSMAGDKAVWGDFGLVSQSSQGMLAGTPVQTVGCNNVMDVIQRSAVHEPVGFCAPSPAVPTGVNTMAFVNPANTAANQHPHSQNNGSGTHSIWAVTNRTNNDMASRLLPPFNSMAVTGPQRPMTPEPLATHKLNPSAFNSPFPAEGAIRNTPASTTYSHAGRVSSFSTPVRSPPRRQAFRSANSAWAMEPVRGTATPGPNENTTGTRAAHFGDIIRYGSPNPSLKPIGHNQNGMDWRQRRMKQIAKNDPFGLGLNDGTSRHERN
ncbi:C-x8-C-x5-C-x3-H zinc finger protein [Blastomyces dermatitidis ATCC 18188]|uniref:C-x8-C-x5-C-x3-H zinc finger protein n=1 Tax=Ajellomyces dermatitidis (strain ATCC 18188 / CBS 674.68) TaxID=653446 RepID=F2TB17_AJEDA|nr:C-x8-C-x5-C-x3-H zinc finger protein [Blastomyces dermatitidis ATCC 18188]